MHLRTFRTKQFKSGKKPLLFFGCPMVAFLFLKHNRVVSKWIRAWERAKKIKKKKVGCTGFRSPYLPHAKRTCYQVHHAPFVDFAQRHLLHPVPWSMICTWGCGSGTVSGYCWSGSMTLIICGGVCGTCGIWGINAAWLYCLKQWASR